MGYGFSESSRVFRSLDAHFDIGYHRMNSSLSFQRDRTIDAFRVVVQNAIHAHFYISGHTLMESHSLMSLLIT
jgi:hypothetical protein